MSEPEYIFRCCRCHEDEVLHLKTATLMRLECAKDGPTLHRRWVKQSDGSLEPAIISASVQQVKELRAKRRESLGREPELGE
jgi:hypothetical protein